MAWVWFLVKEAFLGFPANSAGKESTCNAGDPSLIPGSGRSTGEGKGYLLKVSWAPCVLLGKESACNSGDLGSNPGLGRFPWRRERLPTPVFWPGEFHGLYSPQGPKELDMTERLFTFKLCLHMNKGWERAQYMETRRWLWRVKAFSWMYF